jgi:RNA polymerase sigma factor (sigma-70 family)
VEKIVENSGVMSSNKGLAACGGPKTVLGRHLGGEVVMADELVDRFRRDRDRRDYVRIVEANTPLVASVCRRLLRDPNDVDDVVQETFLKLLGNADLVTGSLSGWLAATAQAASVDLIRREVRERNRRRARGNAEPRSVEHLATREAIRLRLHEAMLAVEPATRGLIEERFVRNTPLGVLAVQLKVSVPTAHRRVADAVRELADVLRGLGVAAATEQAVANQLGGGLVLDDPDLGDHGELRFAPDWRSAELTPFGAGHQATFLPGWTRPLRIGVMISYNSTIAQPIGPAFIGTKWQVHSTAFMPPAGLQLVGVVEPGTVHRGVVESSLRDYGIVGGLIEADDETALSTLDVLLLGFNRWMTASIARAIGRAVRGGVGLLNEFWTASMVNRDDPEGVSELMLAASDVYKYHMPGRECGTGMLPATVLSGHPLLPGLKPGARMMLRGCGPAYKVIPGAQLLVTKDHVVPPHEHGMTSLGPIQMPCYILGQLGRGRVAVVHAWPHQWFSQNLSIGHEQYFLNLINWLAASERR